MLKINSSYLLLGVYHYGIIYCGSYNKINDKEIITSINTGEQFYNIRDFFISVKGLNDDYELLNCLYFDEDYNNWLPIMYLSNNT